MLTQSNSLILSILDWKSLHLLSKCHGFMRRWHGDGMDSGKELLVVSISLESPAKMIINKGPWEVDGREEI